MAATIHVRLETLSGARPTPKTPSDSRTFYLETFGCQMNVHDSEKVAGLLLERGYCQVEDPDAADLILYNTCSIREKAAQKLFSRLGEHRKSTSTGKVVGVLGCVAQQEGARIFERAPWVSLVCGSASYRRLPELLAFVEEGKRRVTGLDLHADETFETELTRRDNPFRAYITIIEGCDKRCAFCVVPSTRGPERSRRSDSILSEVQWLAAAGYSEVQLLGQTVDSYRDPSPRGLSFAQLLLAVASVPGIRRVRFTTSHPRDFDQDIVRAIGDCPVICEHVHLPVQAGSNRVLERMRRGYTREDYLARIEMIRAAPRPISITTDIIVGFPGETEEDFQQTLTLVDQAQYDGVFAFKYSPRPNTSALQMPGQIPEEEKGRRLGILLERQRQIQAARNEALVGQTVEVLVDGRHESKGQWAGRTSSNRVVNFTSPHAGLLGKYILVMLQRAGPNSLAGVHAC